MALKHLFASVLGDTARPRETPASPWVVRFAPLVAAGGPVLDLAAGRGRHSRLFLDRGHPVTALDRDTAALRGLGAGPDLEIIETDLETAAPWRLEGRRFAGIVVTNYLWRPALDRLVGMLDAGGVLIYETFAQGNERFRRPRNPDFLLRPGELLEAVRGTLTVVAYEHGRVRLPWDGVVQRICAVSTSPGEAPAPLVP